ncbi:alpha/beta-hydrolase [Athelia psychrophila]|uniref:carboxypeptidase C n=1 Tax=Athelia psychrophila TaxID=1759441 RepID=A0A167WCV5_9AGAM|nr:alpha/beta-hydrolase [Fibularhizoctonia sp. CBS 109695]
MIQWIRIILFIVTLVVSTSATQQSFQVVADLDKAYVTDPGLCDNGSKQYSGYLTGSPLFFWFFESRSSAQTDPIGIWLNGGPGSSSLVGMDFVGPCQIVLSSEGVPVMQTREWSWNRNQSILMIDNPKGTGFSQHLFPAVDSTYLAAVDLYEFLQSFIRTFPQYAQHELALNSLSYGGHYAPVYSAYILHRNALVKGDHSLFGDVWDSAVADERAILNLRSISIGNGWFSTTAQAKAHVDFSCGKAEGVPILLTESECNWSYRQWEKCETMLTQCEGIHIGPNCAAAGIFCLDIFKLYKMHGYNSFDWRTKISYPEDLITQFYNNVSTQIALGVLPASASVAIQWHAHSSYVNLEFTTSGDHWTRTDYLIERILRSGIDVLKYEGLVDWTCNFLGIRHLMSHLPGYAHQEVFNGVDLTPWAPFGKYAGEYKCLRGSSSEGLLCYLEIEEAGHIVAHNKPREAAWMIDNWVQRRTVG